MEKSVALFSALTFLPRVPAHRARLVWLAPFPSRPFTPRGNRRMGTQLSHPLQVLFAGQVLFLFEIGRVVLLLTSVNVYFKEQKCFSVEVLSGTGSSDNCRAQQVIIGPALSLVIKASLWGPYRAP